MSRRAIRLVTPAVPVDMDGLEVKQPLPHPGLAELDPFLLLHHVVIRHEGGHRPQEDGVPPHPHRGFEPVTFIYRGGVHHRDSRGNDSVIHESGVQWITAGLGLIHSERPPRALSERGGVQEIVQLWVNLPRRAKLVQPRYQGFQRDALPLFEAGGVRVQVIAGAFEDLVGPVETHTPVTARNVTLARGARFEAPLPEGHAAFAYLLDGSVRVDEEETVRGERLIAFERAGTSALLEALEDTRLLLMTGMPLGEPVVRSGPFVMNDTTEILAAMRDAQMGRMGVLIESFDA
jgi:redox-sensitive bicupin YhaK (pirin superfamily)